MSLIKYTYFLTHVSINRQIIFVKNDKKGKKYVQRLIYEILKCIHVPAKFEKICCIIPGDIKNELILSICPFSPLQIKMTRNVTDK